MSLRRGMASQRMNLRHEVVIRRLSFKLKQRNKTTETEIADKVLIKCRKKKEHLM